MEHASRWGCLALFLTSLAGCKTCDLVEAELRYKERQNRQLQRCLCQKEAELETLHAQLAARDQIERPGEPKDTSESIYRRTSMSRVSLGLGTGGRDQDRDGTNEAAQFTIVCHDYDGDPFKCPGTAELRLVANLDNGIQEVVGEWLIEPDQLRQKWKSSVVGSGYQVIVPVTTSAEAKKWTMEVRFTTLDGRTFKDERQIATQFASSKNLPTKELIIIEPSVPDVVPNAGVVEPIEPPIGPVAPMPDTSYRVFDQQVRPTVGLTEFHEASTSAPRARFLQPRPLSD